MNLIASFFAGAFLCNAVPHLAAGLLGMPFPSPFAKPHGVGNSSPRVNFFWGSFNLGVGAVLLHAAQLAWSPNFGLLAFALGWLALGTFCADHFGKVRAGLIRTDKT